MYITKLNFTRSLNIKPSLIIERYFKLFLPENISQKPILRLVSV